ncbi:GAF domain-containing protein [Streptomyces varsoviensis]|uniref:GAF domain-containing protein n=1 Tax=Streptomyces varsoviensis TaxID=67373 RepID=UPI00340587AF
MNRRPIPQGCLPAVRDAVLGGGRPPAAPRPVIGDSWHRVRRSGLDPDTGRPSRPLSAEELEHRRHASPLGQLLPQLRSGLMTVADAERHLLVVTDPEGRVLWRYGDRAVRRRADRIEFGLGAAWSEDSVGTNAIGTALVERRPVQVHSAEHFVRTHHAWTCAASPLHDPRDGRLLGVVDVSGPAETFYPATLALVTAVAKVAEGELRARHWETVDRLRSMAAPLLCRLGGRAMVVDRDGWTAAVVGMASAGRVALPKSVQAGRVWLPSLGMCSLQPLPDGWLVRVEDREAQADERARTTNQVVVDLRRPRPWTITVSGEAGRWTQDLTPRHAELLYALARHRDGRTAAELAVDLFGDATRAVTVRAEMSRMRRTLAGVLTHRPYRFAESVDVRLRCPCDPADLLPGSTAPLVLGARRGRGTVP